MKTLKACIRDGVVCALLWVDDNHNHEEGEILVDCNETLPVGSYWNGTEFLPSKPVSNEELERYAEKKRWEKEVGGISFQGSPVATDDRSKTMILGTCLKAQLDANLSTPWVFTDKTMRYLTSSEIMELSDALFQHVLHCFGTFEAVKSGVSSGSITTFEEIDGVFASISTTY